MIAVATCLNIPEPDVDEDLLLEALRSSGLEVNMVAWDDPNVDWSAYRMCVIRSTWNYPEYPELFRAWLDRVGHQTTVYNNPATAKWNIDKRYLEELQKRGVEVVPTAWFDQGEKVVETLPWQDVVVKPTISAGSWLTERFRPGQQQQALRFLREQLVDRGMMVQPYLPSVEKGGEVAWVWIDGEVTHGVRKSPRFRDGEESVSEAVEPDEEARTIVKQIMSLVPSNLLYARIDLMEHEGRWLLSELELIEPSLFFKQNSLALDVFVQAVKRRNDE